MSLVQTIAVIDANGATQNVPVVPNNLLSAWISFSAGGDLPVVAAVAGKTVVLYRLYVKVAAATVIELKDSGGGVLAGPYNMAANDVLELSLSAYAWHTLTAGLGFTINSSNAVQVTGTVLYLQQ